MTNFHVENLQNSEITFALPQNLLKGRILIVSHVYRSAVGVIKRNVVISVIVETENKMYVSADRN